MRALLLLLSAIILQISLLADDDSSINDTSKGKSAKTKQAEKVDEETKETLAVFFEKPELVDLPTPKSFVMLKESFVHVASSFRYGEIYLEGSLVIDSVFNFYLKQMELAGWSKGDLSKTDRTVLKFTKHRLVFFKDRDKCIIHIGKNNKGEKTVILIDLKPISYDK